MYRTQTGFVTAVLAFLVLSWPAAAAGLLDARASFPEVPAYSGPMSPPKVWEFNLKGPAKYRVRVVYAPWYRNSSEMIRWRSKNPIDGRDFGAWVEFIPGANVISARGIPEPWVDGSNLEKVAEFSIRHDQPGMELSINPPTVRFGGGSFMQLKASAQVTLEPVGAGDSNVSSTGAGQQSGGSGGQHSAGASVACGNAALNKPASASNSYSTYVPGQANDGNPATIWNGGSHQACLTVDLQGVYAIREVVVRSNQFGSGGLQTVFQVSSSLNNSDWTPVGPTYSASGDRAFTIAANGAKMRYIRYCTLAGSTNWATLGELEAFGSRVGN